MRQQQAAPPAAASRRPWLAAAGVALIVAALGVTGLARRYVVAESAQFLVFVMVAPALIVLGAPWRLLRLSRPAGPEPGQPGTAPLDRLAAARRQQTSFLRAAGFLAVFIAAGVASRLPPVVDALARYPAVVAVELITLLAAGTGLWLELVSSPPLEPRLPNPHRSAIAALAMWSTWAVGYALGLANHAVFHGYDGPGSSLSAVADQQITVASGRSRRAASRPSSSSPCSAGCRPATTRTRSCSGWPAMTASSLWSGAGAARPAAGRTRDLRRRQVALVISSDAGPRS